MSLDGVSSKKAEPGQMKERKLDIQGGVIMGSVFLERKEKFVLRGEGYSEVGMSFQTAFSTYVRGVIFRPVRSLTKDGAKKNKNEKEKKQLKGVPRG